MEFQVLRSSSDPSYHVITDKFHQNLAVDEHLSERPDDPLIPVISQAADSVLADVPDIQVVRSFINLLGYYAHATR